MLPPQFLLCLRRNRAAFRSILLSLYTRSNFFRPQILSWNPRIVYYPNFILVADCEHIRQIAERRLTPSSLALRAGDTADNTKDVRTRRVRGTDTPDS